MSAGVLAAPGTEPGPCEHECGHSDCVITRRMASQHCRWCSEPIGYQRRFYAYDEWLTHAVCEEERGSVRLALALLLSYAALCGLTAFAVLQMLRGAW